MPKTKHMKHEVCWTGYLNRVRLRYHIRITGPESTQNLAQGGKVVQVIIKDSLAMYPSDMELNKWNSTKLLGCLFANYSSSK